jgi:tetratricopeptide (TPR) repeat protein
MARTQARVAKGDVYLQQSKFAKAEKLFREAVAVEPTLPSAHLGLGAALIGQRRYDEAIPVLAEAERRYAEFDEMQRVSGVVAVGAIDDTERKVDTFKGTYKVFSRGPTNQQLGKEQVDRYNVNTGSSIPANAYYLQGVAYLRTDQNVAGIERLDRCLELDADHGLAHHNLAVAMLSIGRINEAKTHLDAAVAAGVEPPPALIAEIDSGTRERVLADGSPH